MYTLKLKLNKRTWYNSGSTAAAGFIRINDEYTSGAKLAEWFAKAGDSESLKEIISSANGQFAVVSVIGEKVIAATDRLRSIPLFYCIEKSKLVISDSAYAAAEEIEKPVIDSTAASVFLAAGYTIERMTLLEGLFQVEPGGIVVFGEELTRDFYYDCTKPELRDNDFIEEARSFVSVADRVFRSHLDALKGRFIAVPLSGGYDSRLIALMCKRYHPENLLCYTYGREGNTEVRLAQEASARLGIPWLNIIYDESLVSGFLNDSIFHSYYPYASELSSMFFLQDYFAVKYLKDNNLIPSDALFMPGFSGDWLAGGHLKPLLSRKTDRPGLIKEIISDNFIMSSFSAAEKKRFIRMLEPGFPEKITGAWRYFESWEMRERMSKFIVNSSSAFTFFGYDYIMPLWDNEITDFFFSMPFHFKNNKVLYDHALKNYLFSESDLNFTGEINPAQLQRSLQRIRNRIKRFLPAPVINLLIDHESPLMADTIASLLTEEAGKSNFKSPPAANIYNSYYVQWYLLKTCSRYNK